MAVELGVNTISRHRPCLAGFNERQPDRESAVHASLLLGACARFARTGRAARLASARRENNPVRALFCLAAGYALNSCPVTRLATCRRPPAHATRQPWCCAYPFHRPVAWQATCLRPPPRHTEACNYRPRVASEATILLSYGPSREAHMAHPAIQRNSTFRFLFQHA